MQFLIAEATVNILSKNTMLMSPFQVKQNSGLPNSCMTPHKPNVIFFMCFVSYVWQRLLSLCETPGQLRGSENASIDKVKQQMVKISTKHNPLPLAEFLCMQRFPFKAPL